MTTDEAIRHLRASPEHAGLVEEAYLDADAAAAAERFHSSVEVDELLGWLGGSVEGQVVVDLGAGTGIASSTFARLGARLVVAVEPDRSDVVGVGALRSLVGPPVVASVQVGEHLGLREGGVDLVYCRQVLHHTHDLPLVLREAARVLRPGGRFVAVREHVVDDAAGLEAFLSDHAVHQLAGGESAYRLDEYVGAVEAAGLRVERLLGPWDCVTNAFPVVRSADELRRAPELVLAQRLGAVGRFLGRAWPTRQLAWARLRRPKPGRLYSIVASKG